MGDGRHLKAALTYIDLDLPVMPLYPILQDGRCACLGRGHCAGAGKHPATRWRNGDPDELPTRDPLRARAWWGAGNDRNGFPLSEYGIGLPTGSTSGLSAIDLDHKPLHGKDGLASFAALVEKHGAPAPGPRARTGGGGRHLLFRHWGPDFGGTVNLAGPGIDTRGEKAYVVVAPSVHRSGNRYAWEERLSNFLPDRVPEVPEWFLAHLRAQRPDASARTGADQRAAPAPSKRTVPHAAAAAALVEALDSRLVWWAVRNPDEVTREPWRGIATCLHAVCDGHTDLVALARRAWHRLSEPASCYSFTEAERTWVDAAKSPPMSYRHMREHGAPSTACPEDVVNLAAHARLRARDARETEAFAAAALAMLVDAPGELTTRAREAGLGRRAVLLDEGFLEDTAGYVPPAALVRKFRTR